MKFFKREPKKHNPSAEEIKNLREGKEPAFELFAKKGKNVDLRKLEFSNKGNSALLDMLIHNAIESATFLICLALRDDKGCLESQDSFTGAKNSALILAAKIGNKKVATFLLQASNRKRLIGQKDYLGNTALHYSCLMRNHELSEQLLECGANIMERNKVGATPKEYLELELTDSGLEYSYGVLDGTNRMKYVNDVDDKFAGTKQKEFSCYRWFLPQIIINLGLGKDAVIPNYSVGEELYIFLYGVPTQKCAIKKTFNTDKLFTVLEFHVRGRLPLMDLRVYNAAAEVFIKHRHRISTEDFLNPYVYPESDCNPLHF